MVCIAAFLCMNSLAYAKKQIPSEIIVLQKNVKTELKPVFAALLWALKKRYPKAKVLLQTLSQVFKGLDGDKSCMILTEKCIKQLRMLSYSHAFVEVSIFKQEVKKVDRYGVLVRVIFPSKRNPNSSVSWPRGALLNPNSTESALKNALLHWVKDLFNSRKKAVDPDDMSDWPLIEPKPSRKIILPFSRITHSWYKNILLEKLSANALEHDARFEQPTAEVIKTSAACKVANMACEKRYVYLQKATWLMLESYSNGPIEEFKGTQCVQKSSGSEKCQAIHVTLSRGGSALTDCRKIIVSKMFYWALGVKKAISLPKKCTFRYDLTASSKIRRAIGGVGLCVGGLSLISGVVTLVVHFTTKSEFDTLYAKGDFSKETLVKLDELFKATSTLKTVSTTLLVIAGVSLAAGTGFLIWDAYAKPKVLHVIPTSTPTPKNSLLLGTHIHILPDGTPIH